jgi:glutathione S-transferase
MEWVTLIVLLALLEAVIFGIMVGYARGKYKVVARAALGHKILERYVRVQQNTLELLIIFIPSILFFGKYISATWGAALGGIFVLGRALYAVDHLKEPRKDALGLALSMIPTVVLSMLPTLVLLIGALIGAVRAIVATQALRLGNL